MKIGNDIYYVGVNDHQVDLFEGQYEVPNGMSYNSYVIKDEKIAVMDTVDANFTEEWLGNVAKVLDGAKPDYLVVQHMEPDHAANVAEFLIGLFRNGFYGAAKDCGSEKSRGFHQNFGNLYLVFGVKYDLSVCICIKRFQLR